ncbi:Uncharacterised protein [Stutzerimonas stutzeri]|uniref:DUF7210 family protein n=1 Tax=Stutzerimonas stutzeri subgroup TaxID=578833 RepID=UPI000F6F2731|nr:MULTISPECIES: hypothetical protein [Stutzerimonas stutzeri subgroup]MCQ2048817.1 hypothetical protein [Stutzerimonas kunmingensis]QQC13227.1 hypothetical protein I6I22_10640 [Stutzerimonas stutzeri]VEI35347.1 Uncharacterised protein [Stutzerimonas stutzeri]
MTTNATAAPARDSAALKKAPELVEVTLAKPHTHQRKPYDEGAKIKVTPAQRAILIARGIVAGSQEA